MALHITLILLLVSILGLNLCFGHERSSNHHHHCTHDHHHHHHHHHDDVEIHKGDFSSKLPEELAEEEDLKMYGLDFIEKHDHGFDGNSELSGFSLWIHAMGCSLLVSMASLICLILLPVIFVQGKPSKILIDSLAVFGAGAMLGDAFLHQLPHAFGGDHSHSRDHHVELDHDHLHKFEHVEAHSHSLKDLSVGLSILFGIIFFLLVEKVVRYVEDHSGKGAKGHSHHNKGRNEDDNDKIISDSNDAKDEGDKSLNNQESTKKDVLRKRITTNGTSSDDKIDSDAPKACTAKVAYSTENDSPDPSSLNLVFGYLNLFSDGVHNFTDGMALGSAFLLYGPIGGWSRTLFLLAHELPQEVGDFGILVRSGFSVGKALFFNFLSALVALAGTALALLLGQDPGQSSLIEGFTAGGFIYIAVAGVLPEMNSGKTTFKSTVIQLTSLILGMAVALCISLVE
ncbi:hypothetical protein GIB67_005201 [Kingdonia uniflora]|uniref:IAA-alanine resistance protein 1 n=1 Tax=Kingdonia uniflora TaxID=39325 RepID=A0A7J7NN18_9MAGN|nr:hypothetical protein GIB67_005201 [Kingdonia uniflora]